jgi:hypothetical protein
VVSPEPSNSDTIFGQLLHCFHVLHPNLCRNTDRRIADSYQITYRMNVQDHRRDEVSSGEGQTMVLCVLYHKHETKHIDILASHKAHA